MMTKTILFAMCLILTSGCGRHATAQEVASQASSEATVADTKEQGRATTELYPVPLSPRHSGQSAYGWQPAGDGVVAAAPGDPRSPRRYEDEISSSLPAKEAVAHHLEQRGVQNAKVVAAEPMELFPATIYVGTSTLGGKEAVFFGSVHRETDEAPWSVSTMVLPRDVFESWGGMSVALVTEGTFESLDEIGEVERREIAAAPLGEQLTLFRTVFESALATEIAVTQKILNDLAMRMGSANVEAAGGRAWHDAFLAPSF